MTRRANVLITVVGALVASMTVAPATAIAEQASAPSVALAATLDSGRYHTCAVVPPGDVRCWGYGDYGALGHAARDTIGDDETPADAAPVEVGSGRTVTSLSAGTVHTCAVRDDGSVICWGFGGDGRLGYANTRSIGDDEPPADAGAVDIGAGRTATAVAAGRAHSCALLDGGDVRCWGFNFDGRLGLGGNASVGDPWVATAVGDDESPASRAPVDLGPGRSATAITAGEAHTCALLDDGTVRCWGTADHGQLGYGDTVDVGDDESPADVGPVDIGPGRTATAIAAGDFHTCVVLDDGDVRCWGLGGSGRLGNGAAAAIGDDETPASAPTVDLGAGRTAKAISAGDSHTCALLDDGSMRCWGYGRNGQLGYASTASVGVTTTPAALGPIDLGPGRTAVTIAAGGEHTCARLDDASVRCWGRGLYGEVGHCSTASIGDDETPGTIDPVNLGVAGVPAGRCRLPPPPPPPPPARPPAPPVLAGPQPLAPPPPAVPDRLAGALRDQDERARALRSCRTSAARRARGERRRARRIDRRPARSRALRAAVGRAAQRRRACLRRFARTPARVTTPAARASGARRAVVLSFKAVGTDGPRAPAAQGYVVKQSTRPIRTARDFSRARALCRGNCRFAVTQPGAAVSLTVTGLRRRTAYHYAVAARDNVSGKRGPRSRTVMVRTR